MIPIYKPYISDKSIEYAKDAIDSGWISSKGKYSFMATDMLSELMGVNHCVLTNNGTSATHLMAIGVKFQYPNINKIVVPSNVYIAAWNAFKMTTDYEFICLDSDLNTWNCDYDKLSDDEFDKDTAFLIVHNVGNIINVPKLKLKHKDNVFIEDNCEGFMGKYEGKYSGTESWLSSVSFYGNKVITSGEGGAVFTNDTEIYDYLNSVKGQGSGSEKFVFDKFGYNYRMTNIQAALLCGQIEDLDFILENKQRVFDKYKKELLNVEEISFQKEEENTQHSKWLIGIKFNNFDKNKIKDIELHLYSNGIETRSMFPPINYHNHYKNIKQNFENSEELYNSVLVFPSYPNLLDKEIEYICNVIKKYMK